MRPSIARGHGRIWIGAERRGWSALLLWVLLGCSGLGGCDRAAPQVESEPAGRVDFLVDEPGVYYARVTPEGGRSATVRRAQIPASERLAVVVLMEEKTPDVEGHHYVADLVDVRSGELVTATLRSTEEIRALLDVGEAAALRGREIFEGAVAVVIELVDKEPALSSESGRGTTRRAGARKTNAPNGPVNGGVGEPIEILRIQGAESSPSTVSSTAPSRNWKPVTLYYADWCGYCRKARAWLAANNVPHRAVDIEASKSNKNEMVRFAASKGGRPGSVPTFRIGDELMQGWHPERFVELAGR